jgi:hypothetical protein
VIWRLARTPIDLRAACYQPLQQPFIPCSSKQHTNASQFERPKLMMSAELFAEATVSQHSQHVQAPRSFWLLLLK